jgi:hypothetical protein
MKALGCESSSERRLVDETFAEFDIHGEYEDISDMSLSM